MNITYCDIKVELSPYIKMICIMTCDARHDVLPFRVLPDACVELFVSCDQKPIAKVSGQSGVSELHSFVSFRMCSYMDVAMKEKTRCIAVCFKPGAAYRFFPMPMSEVADHALETDLLWHQLAREMEDKVAHAKEDRNKLDIIQDFLFLLLSQQYGLKRPIIHSMEMADAMKGLATVKELAEVSHISERQLNRRFKDGLGMSPKEYLAMTRFMYTLSNIKKHPELSLTELAFESAYFDQSHFIHSCRLYAGLSPGELRSRKDIVF